MARAIDADELEMFPYSEGAGTEEQISEWIEQTGLSEDDTASRARDLCWKVIDGFINVVKTQPTLTQPNEGAKDKNVPTNEPLTLEELREMDGRPVWVDDKKTWALLQVWDDENIDAVFPMPRGCFHAERVIGRKIYRRPPDGEKEKIFNE